MTYPLELQAARLRLVKERPYLAAAAWALHPIPKPGLGTLAVDMYWRLYYDPKVLAHWSVDQMWGVLYHEICHLLRDHAARMKDFNPNISNIAADAEINDDLISERIQLPEQPITPQSLGLPNNLLAEEYYIALESKKQNQKQDGYQDQKEIPNHVSQAYPPNPMNNSSEDEKGAPRPGAGRCGSCATGQKAPWEDEPPNHGSRVGISQTEGEIIRKKVAKEIKEHMKGQGRVPGHLSRWAEEKLQPKVDWKKQLARVIRYALADTAGATDYSYRRPSRRQGRLSKGEVILPSLRQPVFSVVIIADTSASITDLQLGQTLAEIAGILRSIGQKEGVHVLAVDRVVQSCRKVFRPEQIRLTGGGGTNMGAGLEEAAKIRPFPQLGIVLTDGYTQWPDHPPKGMKVIVLLSGDGTAPEWAEVIYG